MLMLMTLVLLPQNLDNHSPRAHTWHKSGLLTHVPAHFQGLLDGEGDSVSQRLPSSSLTRLRSNGIEPLRVFPVLGDLYPITSLGTAFTENKVTGSNSRAS